MEEVIEYNNIKLMRASPPLLEAGGYKVSVRQKITAPVTKDMPEAQNVFYVGSPKFSVGESIYSVYPTPESSGNHANTLPHIVFKAKTLPWERKLSDSSDRRDCTPWMALVCFSSGEMPAIQEMTIGELVTSQKECVFCPKFVYDEHTGEKRDSLCNVIDVGIDRFADIFPRQDELSHLAHVRVVDLNEKADSVVPLDGYFSVVVCNRFPVSTLDEGEKNTVCLVSLEGYDGYLPEGNRFQELQKYKATRLVVLHSWSFTSVADTYPGFRKLMENIDSQSIYVKTANSDHADQSIQDVLKRGYIPMPHKTRTRESTVSFYRGPLVPYEVKRLPRKETRTADGEIRYDPRLGVFDMSYSATWQLGRLLALRNKSIANEIYKWRKTVIRRVFARKSQDILQRKLSAFHNVSRNGRVEEIFLDFWASELCGALCDEQAVTPLADSTGLQKLVQTENGLFGPGEAERELARIGVRKHNGGEDV